MSKALAPILDQQAQSSLRLNDQIEKALWPFSAASPVQDLCEQLRQHDAMMKQLCAPAEEARRALDAMMPARSIADSFRLIDEDLVTSQFDRITKSALADMPSLKALDITQSQFAEMQARIDEITQPIADFQERITAITAASELSVLAEGLRTWEPFGDVLTGVLRTGFGDWRRLATIPDSVFADTLARTAFYGILGFDHSLTVIPAPALNVIFEEPEPREAQDEAIVAGYDHGFVIRPAFAVDEDVPALNMDAYKELYRLETHLRKFIDEQMSAAFGKRWMRQRTPQGMYQSWQEKRELARAAGHELQPLIAYADFTDYADIICRGDNWAEVFAPVFSRKTSIQESLIRLYPGRVCTMHARAVVPEEHLMIVAESRRILRAIGVLH